MSCLFLSSNKFISRLSVVLFVIIILIFLSFTLSMHSISWYYYWFFYLVFDLFVYSIFHFFFFNLLFTFVLLTLPSPCSFFLYSFFYNNIFLISFVSTESDSRIFWNMLLLLLVLSSLLLHVWNESRQILCTIFVVVALLMVPNRNRE